MEQFPRDFQDYEHEPSGGFLDTWVPGHLVLPELKYPFIKIPRSSFFFKLINFVVINLQLHEEYYVY